MQWSSSHGCKRCSVSDIVDIANMIKIQSDWQIRSMEEEGAEARGYEERQWGCDSKAAAKPASPWTTGASTAPPPAFIRTYAATNMQRPMKSMARGYGCETGLDEIRFVSKHVDKV